MKHALHADWNVAGPAWPNHQIATGMLAGCAAADVAKYVRIGIDQLQRVIAPASLRYVKQRRTLAQIKKCR